MKLPCLQYLHLPFFSPDSFDLLLLFLFKIITGHSLDFLTIRKETVEGLK
ncbi:unnamed protein product [Nippostrongylus brasiliensis]|uniref:Uncharacterized protein n=1 Tax=Nippostrongylus brasiliensis TaxID=27835 RepID=A0A0N4XUN0_NIPBR|nr:unnamed protein product [Nippostrongylus brasiliensis]